MAFPCHYNIMIYPSLYEWLNVRLELIYGMRHALYIITRCNVIGLEPEPPFTCQSFANCSSVALWHEVCVMFRFYLFQITAEIVYWHEVDMVLYTLVVCVCKRAGTIFTVQRTRLSTRRYIPETRNLYVSHETDSSS